MRHKTRELSMGEKPAVVNMKKVVVNARLLGQSNNLECPKEESVLTPRQVKKNNSSL